MGSFIVNNATVAFWIIYFISWLFVIIEQDYYKAKKNRKTGNEKKRKQDDEKVRKEYEKK